MGTFRPFLETETICTIYTTLLKRFGVLLSKFWCSPYAKTSEMYSFLEIKTNCAISCDKIDQNHKCTFLENAFLAKTNHNLE